MTASEKLDRLKLILGISDTSQDTLLGGYLAIAEEEILNWLYSIVDRPEGATVPKKYEQVEIMACVAGFNMMGAENQNSHSENGINRQFRYPDMLAYIHANVYPYAGVVE